MEKYPSEMTAAGVRNHSKEIMDFYDFYLESWNAEKVKKSNKK